MKKEDILQSISAMLNRMDTEKLRIVYQFVLHLSR